MNKIKLLLCSLFFIFLSTTSFAKIVKSIAIIGNKVINSDYIKSILPISEGGDYNGFQISEAIKALYNTDRFNNIKVNFNRGILTIQVVENPIVNRVEIYGNKDIKTDIILQQLTLSNNLPYSNRKLINDKISILDLYNKKGFLSTKVSVEIQKLKNNRVNIIFNINQGKKSKIDDIEFIGNQTYSSYKLKSVILSRENTWSNFFTSNDIYDQRRIIYDGELLKQFYVNNGFINFSLLSSFVNIANDGGYKLIFNINEGERYKFGDLKLDIQIDSLKNKKDELQSLLKLDNNYSSWFSRDIINSFITKIKNKLNDLGYNFNQVVPEFLPNNYFKSIDVTFVIKRAPKNIIEKINITGNSKTYASVIRRNLNINEGDPYDRDKVEKARINIYNLGYFSNIDVRTKKGSADDKSIINFNVTEQSTGYISLGGGYSTQNGFVVEGKYMEQNLFGTGNSLSLVGSLAQKQTSTDLSFTDPYLFNRNVSGSVDLFHTISDYTDTSSYAIRRTGFSLSIGYNLTENLIQSISYTLSFNHIYDVQDFASLAILQSQGDNTASILSHSLSYDRRNNYIYPTSGYQINLKTDFSGLGGTVYYLRNVLSGSIYKDLYKNIVLVMFSSAGYINKIKKDRDILISDRFFLGGADLRGFDWSGVGPRDNNSSGSSSNALGGNYLFTFREQINFPMPFVNNFGLIFHIFNDNGTVDNLDTNTSDVLKSMYIRSSIGFGLSWRAPFGLISLDWGWAIKKKDYDIPSVFLLNFGTIF